MPKALWKPKGGGLFLVSKVSLHPRSLLRKMRHLGHNRAPWILRTCPIQAQLVAFYPDLSHRMYSLIGFRKSTSTQNRTLDILISNSKQQIDDFVGELTFQN